MSLIFISASLIVFFAQLLFAGMKGRKEAKGTWMWTLVTTFVIYTIAILVMSKNDGVDRSLLGFTLILAGAVVGCALNFVGRWCIDVVALFVMPDNRERVKKGYDLPGSTE